MEARGRRGRLLIALLLAAACADEGTPSGQEPDDAGGRGGNSASGAPAPTAGRSGDADGGGGTRSDAGPDSGARAGAGASGSDSGAAGRGGGDAGDAGGAGDAGDAAAPSWPDESNTGIPDGACPDGLRAATLAEIEPQSGASIECVRFDGDVPYVRQEVSNVTYRFCRFETDSDVFLNLQGGPITIEDSEFSGPAGTWIRAVYEANGLAVRRCDFSGMANAVEFGTDDVVLEDNYLHDFGNVDEEQHADGFQTEGADGFSIVHNTILFNEVWGSTSALLVSGNDAAVRDNLVAGGGYTVHVAGDIDVTGNRFSTMFHPDCGIYGPVYPEALDPSGTWEDNLWHDGPNAGEALDAP